MNIMNFSKANCNNCYKCVRTCKVKAIKIVENQAEIVPELCTTCGHCMSVCPQHARQVHSDLDIIKDKLKGGKKINISIAPSFRGFFENSKKFVWGLKKLGFNRVEETAVGADIVSKLYKEYIAASEQRIFITTCCPSVILMIEKYYPKVIPYLMPFTSPMISHGYLLKDRYPLEETVFLGPCIAKKGESLSKDYPGIIDWVLTFNEVSSWLEDEGIDYINGEELDTDRCGSNNGTSYPLIGGILEGISETLKENDLVQLRVDGQDECKEIFEEIIKGSINNACIEVSACKKSCLGGPSGSNVSSTIFSRVQNLRDYLNKEKKEENIGDVRKNMTFNASFHGREFYGSMPKESEIKEILLTLEKEKEEDYLNCGGCGYETCREKAISIYRGMSHKEMCIHYVKKQREKLSNEIFENSPNGILILDNNYKIIEVNIAFSRFFGVTPLEAVKLDIEKFIPKEKLEEVMNDRRQIIWEKQTFLDGQLHMGVSIIKMESKDFLIVFLTDITSYELRKEEVRKIKGKTLEITQAVVDKQMRIAQEIASLLGETTAETKVAFNKLRDVYNQEGEL